MAPVPSGPAIAKIERKVRAAFRAEYADRSLRGQQTLPKRLAAEADRVAEPDERYVLLREAKDRATDVGDAEVALDAAEALANEYTVDGLAIRADAIVAAGPRAAGTAANRRVARAAVWLMREAAWDGRLDEAQRLPPVAAAAARKAEDPPLAAEVDAAARAVQVEQKRAAALADLRNQDPSTNLARGLDLCLGGDWEKALPLLAAGSDPAVADAALADIRAPDAAAAARRIGDAWWNVSAGGDDDAARRRLRERAVHWYRLAYPGLAEVDRAAVGKRLAEAGVNADAIVAAPPVTAWPPDRVARLRPGLAAEVFNGTDFSRTAAKRVDRELAFEWRGRRPDPAVTGIRHSLRWTGVLRVPAEGVTAIVVGVDDGARVFVDDRMILEVRKPQKLVHQVALAPGLHALRVDYWNTKAGGELKVSWVRGGRGAEEPVPPDALFHLPE